MFNLLEEFKDQFNCESSTDPSLLQQDETPDGESAHVKSMSTVKETEDVSDYDKLCSAALSVLITKKGQENGYRDLASNAVGDFGSRVKRFTAKSSGLTMPMCHFAGQNIWILKPTGFNRGKGIHVVNSISKLKKLIKEYSKSKE